MMKIKVSFGNDLRLFKYDGASLSEAFDALTTYIRKTFQVEEYRMQYRDDENDLVTLTSDHELDEAFDLAAEQGKTLKIFVVAVAAQQASGGDVVEEKEVIVPQIQQEEATVPASPAAATEEVVVEENEEPRRDAPVNGGGGIESLKRLLVEDEGFRQEFAAFAQDVVLQLRDGDNFETAVRTALVSHEELASHPFIRDHVIGMLPFIAERAQFAVPFLMNIEPTEIPSMIDRVMTCVAEGEQQMMPFLMKMCGGGGGGATPCGGNPGQAFGMPFFGGGFGPHGGPLGSGAPPHGFGHHGGFGGWRGGRGRGHHGHHGPHGHHGRGRGRGGHGPRGGGRPGGKANSAYGAEIVNAEVTLMDKALVLPNSSQVKTWRIRNSGSEAFPEGTKLKYVGRPFNQLVDGVEFPVESLPAGEEGEVSILLSTPSEAGRYGSAWRLELPDGTAFGPLLRARVVVAGGDEKSSDSDDMADVYDSGVPDKKQAKLEKMLAKRAKLEAQLAKLSAKIEKTEEAIATQANQATEEEQVVRPIVSTLATESETPAGGSDEDQNGDQDELFAEQLAELESMGFDDAQLNRILLRQHNGELEPVLNTLCELRA